MSSEFPQHVRQCKAIRSSLCVGIQAMSKVHRQMMTVNSGKATGSIDIDSALAKTQPASPRWDYGIGHSPSPKSADEVHWIEVHPCTEGEVKAILAKLAWLKGWLNANSQGLLTLTCYYTWISSGTTSISPKSPSRRRLAQAGVFLAGSHYTIP